MILMIFYDFSAFDQFINKQKNVSKIDLIGNENSSDLSKAVNSFHDAKQSIKYQI